MLSSFPSSFPREQEVKYDDDIDDIMGKAIVSESIFIG